jgi:drug/metabolite transporter (DMT)-like permease
MTALLSLLASLLWGGADFLGGTVSRRLATYTVIGVSQAFSLAMLVPVAVLTGEFTTARGYLGWGAAAGLVGLVALGAFYTALADGTMGVVAPIAATGVALPVAVGLAGGDAPSLGQLLGLIVAVLGVLLTSGPELRSAGRSAGRPMALAAVAAVGFGTVIVLVAHGSRSSVVMTLVTMRTVTVLLLLTLAGVRVRRPTVLRADLPVLAVIGAGDVAANACYAVASRTGLLSIVAVLASLYPAVTAMLAHQLLGERLSGVQRLGVLGALGGVALIAAGGGTG